MASRDVDPWNTAWLEDRTNQRPRCQGSKSAGPSGKPRIGITKLGSAQAPVSLWASVLSVKGLYA